MVEDELQLATDTEVFSEPDLPDILHTRSERVSCEKGNTRCTRASFLETFNNSRRTAIVQAQTFRDDLNKFSRKSVRARTYGLVIEPDDSEDLKRYSAIKQRRPDGIGYAPSPSREMDIDISRGSYTSEEDNDEGLSISSAVFLIVTAIIGCGVVALPSLMKLGGWVTVPTLMAVITLAFMEIARVMDAAILAVEGSQGLSKRKGCITSFEDFGRSAYGDVGALVVRSVTTTGFFGNLVVYTILIRTNGANLARAFLQRPLPQIYVTAMLTPVLIFLSMIKDLRAMAAIMPVGVFASLTSCGLICVKSGLDAQAWQEWPNTESQELHSLWPSELQSLGMILAILFSAFSVMGTVPSIRGQMQDPQQFLTAFRLSASLVFLVYMCVMVTGYWGYGNRVHENVVDSMLQPLVSHHSRSQTTAGQKANGNANGNAESLLGCLMAGLVVVYLLIGFALFFACVMGILQKLGGSSSLDCCTSGSWQNRVLRAGLVLSVSGIGVAVPHFREVMAIMSSVCCSCNNVFFPLAFSLKLAKDRGTELPGICRLICHTGIIGLAVFCAGLGLVNSVWSLYRKMSSEGSQAHIQQTAQ